MTKLLAVFALVSLMLASGVSPVSATGLRHVFANGKTPHRTSHLVAAGDDGGGGHAM